MSVYKYRGKRLNHFFFFFCFFVVVVCFVFHENQTETRNVSKVQGCPASRLE